MILRYALEHVRSHLAGTVPCLHCHRPARAEGRHFTGRTVYRCVCGFAFVR